MTISHEIRVKLSNVLVPALGVEEDDIIPSATLIGDLGAESIDFLDIVFRLEREFGIKIPRGELFLETLLRNEADYVRDGRLTGAGLAALRAQMPYADLSALERDPRLNSISDLFTVGLVERYVAWKLEPGGTEKETAHASRPRKRENRTHPNPRQIR